MIDELESKYDTNSTIFFTKLLPWAYVQTDFKCGAPTAWRTSLDSQRLKKYYEMHEDLIPDIVVILKDEIGNYPFE